MSWHGWKWKQDGYCENSPFFTVLVGLKELTTTPLGDAGGVDHFTCADMSSFATGPSSSEDRYSFAVTQPSSGEDECSSVATHWSLIP
jgi:hypothetical protein